MRAFFGAPARDPAVLSIGAALALLCVGVLSGRGTGVFAAFLAAVTIVAVGHRPIVKWCLRWDHLIAVLFVVVLFVPIGRYQLPAGLPFDLDLYRLAVSQSLAALALSAPHRLTGTAWTHNL